MNEFKIKVTAEDETTKVYIIRITKVELLVTTSTEEINPTKDTSLKKNYLSYLIIGIIIIILLIIIIRPKKKKISH